MPIFVGLEGGNKSYKTAKMLTAYTLQVSTREKENEQRDYRYKRSKYAARGIQEYWVVDPTAGQVMILTWVDGLYEEAVFKGDDRIISALFPELQLTTTQVLQAKMES